MKKPLLLSAVLLLGALVPAVPYSAYAGDPVRTEASRFEAAVYPSAQNTKLWMVVERAAHAGKIRVELLDASNHIVYSGTIPKKKHAYKQQFDFSAMTDGLYTFRITDGGKTVEKAFKLATPGFNERLPQRYVTMN